MNRSIPLYSISSVAKALGVPVATLRTWEDRYGLVVPQRSAGGHRVYTMDQLEQLRFVKAQMEQGASASDAHRLLNAGRESEFPTPIREVPASARTSILLVEHDPFAAEREEKLLTEEGYDVTVALGLEDAGKALEGASPALVVLDLLVSGGLGVELCRSIKSRPGAPPVLAISSLQSGERVNEAGADGFLAKPLDPAQFLSQVRRFAGSRSARAESA